MNNILQGMIAKYNCVTREEYINAYKEIVQEIALYSLSQTDFFDNAAFYGGTALRIFYNLDRFSEDLDFSLCVKDEQFSIKKYFDTLTKNFKMLGLNFTPQIKEKTMESNIQSAFLKGNTLEHILLVNPLDDISMHIQKNEVIKIKLEIDTNPPDGATYEYKYSGLPLPYKIKLYDESSLFAGKVHAVLCRNWRKRVKGRDLYDLDFYIKHGCILNLKHLEQRMIQTGHHDTTKQLTLEDVKDLLKKRVDEIDFSQAKEDVLPFINNSRKLDLWGPEYFYYLIDNIRENNVIMYKTTFDLSEFAQAKIYHQDEIIKIYFSNRTHKNNKIKELKIKFNNFIVLSDSILNFGNKINKFETYYVIEGFGETIYLRNNLDLNKFISVLKN